MPLNPAQLTPAASLNRVVLPARGSSNSATAFELLSAEALGRLIRQQTTDLGLTMQENGTESLLPAFDNCLVSTVTPRRRTAEAIAETFVLRMSNLISTLKCGSREARLARPEWDDSYWQAWNSMQVFGLGGGLLQGHLGRFVARRLPETLAESGVDVEIRLDSFAPLLPLIGAARAISQPGTCAVVLDLGHTSVKRAVAYYSTGMVTGLQLMQPLATSTLTPGRTATDVDGRKVAEGLAETWRVASRLTGPGLASEMVCSIACYLFDGQPYPNSHGAYASLRDLSPNLAEWLSREVSARLNRPVSVRLLHDGTAAASIYGGSRNTAVIMLGTALGVGFTSSSTRLLPLSSDFAVE